MGCIEMCGSIYTAPRQMTTQIPMEFCVLVLSICLSLSLWQCEWTTRAHFK